MKDTLVDKLVLVFNKGDHTLLECQRDWHLLHLLGRLATHYLVFLRGGAVEVLLEEFVKTSFQWPRSSVLIAPLGTSFLCNFNLFLLSLQVPSLPLRVHRFLLVDELEDPVEERLNKLRFNERHAFFN